MQLYIWLRKIQGEDLPPFAPILINIVKNVEQLLNAEQIMKIVLHWALINLVRQRVIVTVLGSALGLTFLCLAAEVARLSKAVPEGMWWAAMLVKNFLLFGLKADVFKDLFGWSFIYR